MFNERNEVMEKYINYLSDKGKITKIKNENLKLGMESSNQFIAYFLMIISIVCSILTLYLIFGKDTFVSGYDPVSKFIIITGFALFSIILILVTKYEFNSIIKFNVLYLNNNEMKIKNKIYNIQKEDCYIDIVRKLESYYITEHISSHRVGIKYYLTITRNNKKKSFIITPKVEEKLGDFIFNFEFETSDFKRQKQKIVDELSSQYLNLKNKQK